MAAFAGKHCIVKMWTKSRLNDEYIQLLQKLISE